LSNIPLPLVCNEGKMINKVQSLILGNMKREVFNNNIGNSFAIDSFPHYSIQREKEIIAELFEQLLLFDKITICTNGKNFSLFFLIKMLGLNIVEKLFECGYIRLLIWTPIILIVNPENKLDRSIDESKIIGKQPIEGFWLYEGDLNQLDKFLENTLTYFNIHKDRQRIFIKIIQKSIVIPHGKEFSPNSVAYIIDSYKKNCLKELGLPFNKEPEQLNFEERKIIMKLGYKVLELAILSKYDLKSYENYEHYAICKQNIENIGKAYNVSDNSSTLFRLEGLPNLKELFISEKIDFESVFKFRHLTNAKYYRNWINEIGENSNAKEITREYLNEIKGNTKFFESTQGKFFKNTCVFGVGLALSQAVIGGAGVVAGFGFGLLDTFFLDRILKGKNPSMFIEDIRNETKSEK